ncbi:hypothetical protein [Rhizobium leucaenae]|uniref:hypothetical protein n=1 Tax=Rhizobium leucaenae TaxID=29450 RepID=UPI000B042A48|nr:hypothetical protein [Rhizobium leucaenae]
MQRNAFTPFIDKKPPPSGVEEIAALLCEAQFWRLRIVELTFAGIVVFALGFAIAARCI